MIINQENFARLHDIIMPKSITLCFKNYMSYIGLINHPVKTDF
jgi:hypothetical protein